MSMDAVEMSNVFGFLFAGHGERRGFFDSKDRATDIAEIETTARSMTVTLAYLAAYPEEQDIAVREIQRVLANGRDPVLSLCPLLFRF